MFRVPIHDCGSPGVEDQIVYVATLTLNIEAIGERTLEAANLRYFGIIRFVDQSPARVRKMVDRDDWPKALPKLKDQELADQPKHFEFTEAELVR